MTSKINFSAGTSPAADTSGVEVGDVDQSFSKIDELADALAKLSHASADDAFNAGIKRLTQQASDAEVDSAGEPALSEPTEQSQEPVDSQAESSHRLEIDETSPAAPDVPVESFEPSDEQIVAPPFSEPETLDASFDPAEVVRPLEAFAPSGLDDTSADTDDESFDAGEPQQSEPKETSQTSENVSDEVMTTPPESRSLDPGALEQESAVLDERSHADESDSAMPDDVEEEALGSTAESRLDAEVVDAPPESVADIQSEPRGELAIGETADIEEQSRQEADPPAKMFNSPVQEPAEPREPPDDIEQDLVAPSNEQSDTLDDLEATSIDADQSDQSLAGEQDSESKAFAGVADEPEDHESLTDSLSDAADAECASASLTAEELERQIGEIISSFDEIPQPSAPRPLPQAAASNLADESASFAPEPDIDLGWLAKELDDVLNPGSAEPASEQESESAEVGEPVIEGAVAQEVTAPQLSDQESAASDDSSSIDDAPHGAVAVSADVGADFDETVAEQVESVSEINAPQHTRSQAESAPVQDSEPRPPTQETPADDTPEEAAADLTESVVDELPAVTEGTEPDESTTSTDDKFDELTAQLDELLDGKVGSSPDQTPSDPIEITPPAINTAAAPEETEATGKSLEDAAQSEARVSPEAVGVDQPDDFMALPADESDSAVDKAPVTEVDQQMDEGVADDVEAQTFMTDTKSDDAEAQTFMSGPEPHGAASTEVEDQSFAEGDVSDAEPDTAAEPKALEAESASESGADFMMNDSDLAEDDAQPEAEAVDGESEDEPDAAPEDDAPADSDAPNKGTAHSESASSKDNDDADASKIKVLKDAAVATVRLVRLHEALERIEPVAIPILRRVNYPLRYVPKAARPIVDWVALSFLFWVPIVWVIALLAS